MKQRMLKIIATVMSLVLIILSISVSSFAEKGEEKYSEVIIENNLDLGKITSNKTETIFLAETMHYEGDYAPLVFSTNRFSYKLVKLDDYLPEEAKKYEIVNYLVKDDLFIFVVFLYDTELSYDKTKQEYVENTVYLGTQIVSTTDFESFESTLFTVNQYNDDLYFDLENYAAASDFGCVGDTFVYANTDFIVTKETETKVYIKGIYYTSEDLVNWKINYTPELELFDDTTAQNTDMFYSLEYSVVDTGVVIEQDLLTVCELGGRLGTVEDYSIAKTVATTDFNEYKTIFEMSDDMRDCDCTYASVDGKSETILVIQSFTSYNDLKSHFKVTAVELKEESATTIFEGAYGESLNHFETSDAVYFSCSDGENGSYLVRVDNTLECSTVLTTSSVSPYVGEVRDDKLYIGFGPVVNVFDNGRCSDYYFTGSLYEGYSLVKLVVLEKTAFAYATDKETGKLVIIENIRITGDADFSNKVNSTDALLALQFSAGLVELSAEAKVIADVDESGEVNSSDALRILQYATGLIYNLV